MDIHKPIFVIGTGRCGSTIVFEALAVHEQLGWFSSYNAFFPRLGFVSVMPRLCDLPLLGQIARGEKRQYGQGRSLINKFLPKPVECYAKWQVMAGSRFRCNFLRDTKAADDEKAKVRKAVSQVLLWQGKKRFAAKYTGPSRMTFIDSIFPDALFVHVKRNPKCVVQSLLEVAFWTEDKGRMRPRWDGGLGDNWRSEWEGYGGTPLALTAMQYRAIMEVCRHEQQMLSPGRYMETTYEDFVADPAGVMKSILEFCELGESARINEFLDCHHYVDGNKKYLDKMSQQDKELVERIAGVSA